MPDRQRRRLDRQLLALGQRFPALQGLIDLAAARPGVLIRVPLAVLLIIGGLLGFLPILGFWMIPVGLLLLAVDLPLLRPGVSAALIRGRRRLSLWRRNLRDRKH